jgi:hypothetical protein
MSRRKSAVNPRPIAVSPAEKDKYHELKKLAKRLRKATDRKEAKRLGDELGRMIFGD